MNGWVDEWMDDGGMDLVPHHQVVLDPLSLILLAGMERKCDHFHKTHIWRHA